MKTCITILVIAEIFSSCYKEKNFSESGLINYNGTVQVSIIPKSIPADSFSFSKILIELPYDADSTKSSVQLRTDLGIFVESNSQTITVTAKQNSDSLKRIGVITLKSGTRVGIAHIQYSIQTQTNDLIDTFYNSYPDYLLFSASTLSVKPANDVTGEVTFICKLYKQFGYPSQLNNVSLTVVDSNYSPIGLFRYYNNFSDANSTTQYTYVLGDSVVNKVKYTGKLFAIATAFKNQNHDPIRDTLKLISSK